MSEAKPCEYGKNDPLVNGMACFRLHRHQCPYGRPDLKAGCPCSRNKAIAKRFCGALAWRDCLSQGCSPIKTREFRFTLFLGKYRGIYSPFHLILYPFCLDIQLITPYLIDIMIGKYCRFAKFRFELKNWTLIFKKIRSRP